MCRHMAAETHAAWCASCLHLAYSGLTLLACCMLLLTQPRSLDITWKPLGVGTALPDALVCCSAGFFAFQLWTLVHQR